MSPVTFACFVAATVLTNYSPRRHGDLQKMQILLASATAQALTSWLQPSTGEPCLVIKRLRVVWLWLQGRRVYQAVGL